MSRHRALLAASQMSGGGNKRTNTITLSHSFREQGVFPDGSWGIYHYYNVRALEPVTSDIVLNDSVYPNSQPDFGGTLYSGNTSDSMAFSKRLTSSDDVILSPTEDDSYVYEIVIE